MYIEYFNIIANGAPGSSIFLSITFTLIVAGLIFFRFRKTWPKMVRIVPILTIISLVSVTYIKVNSSSEYNRLKKALINKQHSVIEGTVTNFVPMDDMYQESFNVNGVTFSYNEDISDGAFHNVSESKGILRNGAYVRIFYFENKIIGLWIKE